MKTDSRRVEERTSYPLKCVFDICVAVVALTVTGPILLVSILLVWWQDRYSPFYMARRVARGGGEFTMIKMRSMIVRAESTGVSRVESFTLGNVFRLRSGMTIRVSSPSRRSLCTSSK